MTGETNQELKPLTDQFVRVRVVQMGGVDLSVFQFDPMLSWSVFFMNSDKTIYGRFGRAHPQTKRAKKDSNPNHTVAGLRAALEKALEVHATYQKNPEILGPALAGKTGPKPRWRFADKTPAARKYGRLERITQNRHGCVHCHEVIRTAIDSHFMTKTPIPDRMLWMYPRPHVLGLTMDSRKRAIVRAVEAGSRADTAGLQTGDELITMNGQPLLSIADIQWILHTMPDAGGELPVMVSRANATIAKTMRLDPGWRQDEDFGWRYRMAGYAAWLWAGVSLQDHPRGVRVSHRSPHWFKKTNRDGRKTLAPGDVITEVDGKTGMDRSELLAYLMRDKRLGSTVKLTVLRNSEPENLSFRIPKKQPEVQGH